MCVCVCVCESVCECACVRVRVCVCVHTGSQCLYAFSLGLCKGLCSIKPGLSLSVYQVDTRYGLKEQKMVCVTFGKKIEISVFEKVPTLPYQPMRSDLTPFPHSLSISGPEHGILSTPPPPTSGSH